MVKSRGSRQHYNKRGGVLKMTQSKAQLKVIEAEIVKYGIMCKIEAIEELKSSQKPVQKKGKNS